MKQNVLKQFTYNKMSSLYIFETKNLENKK